MTANTFAVAIRDLKTANGHWQRKVMPDDAFHYMAPHGGGWGVVRMSLSVPESAVLMAAPLVCGRGSAIRSLQLGYRNRFFFLELEDQDYITGRHLQKIEEAANEILDSSHVRIKVLFLCATCVDDLIGSDYESIARSLEARWNIKARTIFLKPIAADGKRPSGLATQESIFSLLEPGMHKDEGANALGCMSPVNDSSELRGVLAAAGIGPLRHAGDCSTLEEFRQMGRSSHNLVIRPAGRLAAKYLERRLGIPATQAPSCFGIDSVDDTYSSMSISLGRDLAAAHEREEAVEATERFRSRNRAQIGHIRCAVGASVNASPFELARALIGFGMQVDCIFANAVLDYDANHIEWLKERAPDLVIRTVSHTSMAEFRELKLSVDIAFGFEAGYFYSGSPTVEISADKQMFGYRGIVELLAAIERTLEAPQEHRQCMFASFLADTRQ